MAAVVRLKRRSDEEPLEALVLACKRKKIDSELDSLKDETPFTAILKFAGTVKDQNEDVSAQILKNLKRDDKKLALKHVTDVTGKLRNEIKQHSQDGRFKVVNCFRALNEADILECENLASGEDGDKALTIVDVVTHPEDEKGAVSLPSGTAVKASPEAGSNDPEDGFVYDLYYASSGVHDRLFHLDDSVSVHPLYQSKWEYRNNDGSEPEDEEEEDDDSNDENNWRNDYPDSDHSIDEDDMRRAMNDMNLSDGEDLSSDTADEDFVYGVTVDPRDVMLYGEGYANYKARILHELDSRGNESDDEAYNAESLSGEEEDPVQRFT